MSVCAVFSLKPLIDFWNQTIAETADGWSPLVEGVRAKLAQAPELNNPLEDISILKFARGLAENPYERAFSGRLLGYDGSRGVGPVHPGADPCFPCIPAPFSQ